MSSGVSREASSGADKPMPTISRNTPATTATMAWVATVRRTTSSFLAPRARDMTTLLPKASPMNNVMIRLITGPLAPTAASAEELTMRPTTARSIELNDCCTMPQPITGSENLTIERHRPCLSSIRCSPA